MVKLTAVIISFNEARNIERCLNSLKAVADDLLVVDSFSTDGTQQLARNCGARIIEHSFEGHIEQKNWAISQAKYPHVLSLDADEALDKELEAAILETKKNWLADGYTVNRLTNFCGTWIRHGTWYPDVKLRMWDSRKGRWAGENPHDRYEMQAGCKIKDLPGHLLHYSYYNFEQYYRQIKLFTDISSVAAYRNGKRANYFKLLANPLWKFIKSYFFNKGLLDGKAGFTISRYSAYGTYLKYYKLLKLQKKKAENSPEEH